MKLWLLTESFLNNGFILFVSFPDKISSPQLKWTQNWYRCERSTNWVRQDSTTKSEFSSCSYQYQIKMWLVNKLGPTRLNDSPAASLREWQLYLNFRAFWKHMSCQVIKYLNYCTADFHHQWSLFKKQSVLIKLPNFMISLFEKQLEVSLHKIAKFHYFIISLLAPKSHPNPTVQRPNIKMHKHLNLWILVMCKYPYLQSYKFKNMWIYEYVNCVCLLLDQDAKSNWLLVAVELGVIRKPTHAKVTGKDSRMASVL